LSSCYGIIAQYGGFIDIEFFDRANICLLVTDIIMPNTSGTDLAATLRSVDPDLPVLYISGFTQDHLEH
jgi:FixJ family two-component response regulator